VTASGNKLEKIATSHIISAFHPKALNVVISNWQVFWLGYCLTPSRLALSETVVLKSAGQWSIVNVEIRNFFTIHFSPFTNLTATGIAPDLHRLPF